MQERKMKVASPITRKERISVLLPEDVPAIHSQKRRVLRQRPPAELRMMLQLCNRDASNLASMADGRSGVVNQPAVPFSEMAVPQIDHGVERHLVSLLAEKQKVARTRCAHI